MWKITNRREGGYIQVSHQKFLLQIIEEEINRFLLEQAAPPVAPAPPADPTAAPPGTEAPPTEEGGEENTDEVAKTIKSLAAKTPIDIKKTLLASLQNGAEKSDTEDLIAFVNVNKKEQDSAENEEEIPHNIKKAVKHIIKIFKFKIPEEAKKKAEEKEKEAPATPSAAQPPAAAPATPPAAPVTESRLQTSLREYLAYKRLIQKR